MSHIARHNIQQIPCRFLAAGCLTFCSAWQLLADLSRFSRLGQPVQMPTPVCLQASAMSEAMSHDGDQEGEHEASSTSSAGTGLRTPAGPWLDCTGQPAAFWVSAGLKVWAPQAGADRLLSAQGLSAARMPMQEPLGDWFMRAHSASTCMPARAMRLPETTPRNNRHPPPTSLSTDPGIHTAPMACMPACGCKRDAEHSPPPPQVPFKYLHPCRHVARGAWSRPGGQLRGPGEWPERAGDGNRQRGVGAARERGERGAALGRALRRLHRRKPLAPALVLGTRSQG